MRNRLFGFLILFIHTLLTGQISLKTDLPADIKANSDVPFEVKIWKGPIKNFSKYQMEVPPGITISEVDCRTGSFSQEEGLVKVIWAITPAETEFTIKLKMTVADVKGEQRIVQKYYYLDKGEKREIEMPPLRINFGDAGEKLTVSEPTSQPKTSPGDSAQANGSAAASEELKQHVQQLKKDSKEANEVGNKEKAIAEKKLAEANEAVVRAKALPNPKERSVALQKAMTAKDKAESDLAVANRILSLAKSLDDDASEIEKLNQSLDSVGVNEKKSTQITSLSSTENTTTGEVKGEARPPINSNNVEKARQSAINKGAKDAKGLYKPIVVNKGNVKEVIQQVAQIKRDAKEARDVGNREKKKAEQKLNEAYDALKKSEYISDEEEKKIAVEKATLDKQRAEKDLEVASKILTLANSLEENARHIEKMHNVEEPTDAPPAPATPTVAPASESGSVAAVERTPKQVPEEKKNGSSDIEKLEKLFKEEKKEKAPASEKTAEKPKDVGSEGLVFKLQIGAFNKDPDKTQFVPIGKVQIIKEGAMFKALYGSFKTREEAVARRDEIRKKGFDGFVVMFQNGVKVK
jgi:hypothetical protein